MMKKVWPVLLAVVLVSGLAMLGCKGGGEPPPDPFVAWEYTGPFEEADYNLGGSGGKTYVYDDASGFLSFQNDGTTSGSATFLFKFDDIGYTLNRSDILIFTYEVTVETDKAVIVAKDPSSWGDDFTGDSDWGVGKGREYVLGDAEKSVYEATEGRKVAGTWDGTTGTFEVLMRYLSAGATGIGFQHNSYAKFDNVEVGKNSKYKVKITNIKNKPGSPVVDPPPPPPPPETLGTKLVLKVAGVEQDTTVTGVSGTVGYLDDNNGYLFTRGASWQASYAYFPVALGTNKLSDFDKVKFKYQGVSGDIGYKQIFLVANDAAFSGGLGGGSDDGVAALTITDQKQMNGTDVTNVELTVTRTKASAYDSKTTMYFTIFFNSRGTTSATDDTPTVFIISDIEFVKAAAPFVPVQIGTTITGIADPAAGLTPAATVTGTGYNGTVSWAGTLSTDGKFVQGTVYTATITLTKTAGYTFEGIAANSFVVGTATVNNSAGTSGNTIVITAVFPAATGAVVPVVVWEPAITATTGTDGGGEYIGGGFGIQAGDKNKTTFATIAGGFTISIHDDTNGWKPINIQVGAATGGTNYYNDNGFAAVAAKDYTITFMASVDTGTGQIRFKANGGAFDSGHAISTTPTALTYSWTQSATGGNFQFDTGSTPTTSVITITGIKITTP